MKIELHEIPVRDVVAGYVDSAENGIVGYGGNLFTRTSSVMKLSEPLQNSSL